MYNHPTSTHPQNSYPKKLLTDGFFLIYTSSHQSNLYNRTKLKKEVSKNAD
ncbi:hypothetical protein FC82_GL002467 [Secundilactobacillus collinoides DSM 20515 = JCM 1123]|uniref:Uncharacterized protein n=1 Tax=Secundilactobacillus collinoides DSM 20515 = JCM 1123 TaxID=1423733 RepID=A0A0R2B863_SECCO|nr:hypothetical protein FC82_GL002467 [Secundilactobacillus collinoides DSM 20515 = JCM 1123]